MCLAVLLAGMAKVAAESNCKTCRVSLEPLNLSRVPTHLDLIESGQLGGALSPTGPEESATDADRSLFGAAMSAWNRHAYQSALPLFRRHIASFPNSPWKAEAELHLGCEARFNGRYAEAEQLFKGIVAVYGDKPDEYGEVARKAKLRLAMLSVLKGDFDSAELGWREMIERDPDRRRRDYARNWMLRTSLYRWNAAIIRRCGVEALGKFFVAMGEPGKADGLAGIWIDPNSGVSAMALVEYSKTVGMPLAGVTVKDVSRLPVPWVAHYRFGHFVTVTGHEADGSLRLFDPILNHEVVMTGAQFAQEWSGLALVPERSLSALSNMALAATRVSSPDLANYFGGCCGIENVNQDKGGNGPLCGGPCGGHGLCAWAFSPLSMNVLLWDTPLWYTPPIGPAIEFSMSYNSVDADNHLTSFGPKWVFNYHSYCVETPATLAGSVTVFMPDGRNDVYSPSGTNFTAPARVFNILTKTGTNQYTLAFPDGTVWDYGRPLGATNVEQGLLTRISDNHSNAVTLVYDGQPDPKLVAVVDAVLKTSTIHYAESGLIDSITDPFGRSATMTYSNGYVATVTDMGGVQSAYTFYDSGAGEDYVKSVRTLEGTVTFTYGFQDPSWWGMWERQRITATYEDGSTEVLYYNGGEDGNPSTFFTDRNGRTTRKKLGLNAAFPYQGSIVYEQAPDSSQVSYKYNTSLQPTNIADEASQNWSFSYNSVGSLTLLREPNGYQASFTYTNGGFDLAAITEGTNALLFFTYTAQRDLASVSNVLGQTARLYYDNLGRATNVVDALGVAEVAEFGADQRLSRVTRAGAILATLQHDAMGRVTNAVGPEGVSIAATFDNLDRLTTLTLPGERAYEWTYETNSLRVAGTTDRTGRRATFAHNVVGLLTSVTLPGFSRTRFDYTGGELSSLIDAEVHKTKFSYDNRGRPQAKTYPDGTSNQVAWTTRGLPSQTVSPRGISATYAFEASGLLTNVVYAGTTSTPAISLRYDAFNRVTNAVDGWCTNRFTYDILGRITQAREVQGVFTQTFDYAFDQGGRLTNVAWTAGTNAAVSTRYQYDNLNRITNLVSDAGSFGYTYASNGVLVKTLRYPNAETANYTFDGLRRMTNLLYKTSGGSANGQWSYAYDGRDFVIRRTDPATNNCTFRYEEVGRLVEALGTKNGTNVTGYPFQYGFDHVGNRVRQVEGGNVRRLTYNVNNQLVNWARSNEVFVAGSVNEAGTGTVVQVKSDSMTNWMQVAARYISHTQACFETSDVTVTNLGTNTVWIRATDKSGNSSTQTIHVVASRTNLVFGYDLDGNQTNTLGGSCTWDGENRLVRVDYGTNGSSRMAFDGLGRLREVAEYGTGAPSTNVVRYVWNGWLPWAELDSSNRVQRTFTWGLDLSATVGGAGGIGGLVGMRTYAGAGTNYYVRTDGKGNVTEIRQSNAVVVATYAYAPFGAVLTNTGSYNQPFKFQTKLSHARSGFGYWGYRWYDYKTGRWLRRDALGEAGGLNLYEYCGGNPLSAFDPFGLAPNAEDWAEAKLNAMENSHRLGSQMNSDPQVAFRDGARQMTAIAIGAATTVVGPEAFFSRALGSLRLGKWLSRCKAARTGQTVLGKYPDYLKLANDLGARRFSIPPDIWSKMSKVEQWAANQKFLDRLIARGDEIVLSNPVKNIDEVSGAFRRELDYLIKQGFRLSDDGARLIK
jgi:RHS repeat-associated protein